MLDGVIDDINAITGRFDKLVAGNSTAGALKGNQIYAGNNLYLNGHQINRSNITIEGVTYNICTWS